MKPRPIDIIALEGNANKNEIRNEIGLQILEWRDAVSRTRNLETLDTHVVTLPGVNFVFEQTLTTLYRYAYAGNIAFTCFEHSVACYQQAARHVPYNCTLHLSKLSSIVDLVDDCDVLWADYCGAPQLNMINPIIDYMSRSGSSRLVYFTFCIHPRNGGREKMLRAIRRVSSSLDTQNALCSVIEARFDHAEVRNFHKIYDVSYAGGKGHGNTLMYVIGYCINPYRRRHHVTPIVENRIGTAKKRCRNMLTGKKSGYKPQLNSQIISEVNRQLVRQSLTAPDVVHDFAWRQCAVSAIAVKYGCTIQKASIVVANWLKDTVGIPRYESLGV